MEEPVTRYARSGDVNIAYQVLGDGPFDVVWVPGAFSHVELDWTIPLRAEFHRRIASFCRLIMFDKRGTGMSDRAGIATLETRMDDVRAVMDAAGSERAAIVGVSEGGPMSTLFAATHPQRTWALVLWSSFPRMLWAPDFPAGESQDEWRRRYERVERGAADPALFQRQADGLMPSADEENKRRFAAVVRQSGTPAARVELMVMNRDIDVRHVLPSIRVPTLVLCRTGDDPGNVAGSRYFAAHIPGARLVEPPGDDHIPYAGDTEPFHAALREFLETAWEDARSADEHESVLATVLFTDIVGSTEKMADLGDRGWRDLLQQHHATVRRELQRYRGVEMDTAGDGFFARFDGPARGIRCAQSIIDAVRPLGLDVRAGLHTGECELADGKVAGIAVSIGARVASSAASGEVLVSSTVKDLVAGSGLHFDDRGVRPLKGVPGEWRLYAVA